MLDDFLIRYPATYEFQEEYGPGLGEANFTLGDDEEIPEDETELEMFFEDLDLIWKQVDNSDCDDWKTVHSLDTPHTSHAMMNEFTQKNTFLMEDNDLDFIDDLLDDGIFGSSIREELDPETMKLLEDFWSWPLLQHNPPFLTN